MLKYIDNNGIILKNTHVSIKLIINKYFKDKYLYHLEYSKSDMFLETSLI